MVYVRLAELLLFLFPNRMMEMITQLSQMFPSLAGSR